MYIPYLCISSEIAQLDWSFYHNMSCSALCTWAQRLFNVLVAFLTWLLFLSHFHLLNLTPLVYVNSKLLGKIQFQWYTCSEFAFAVTCQLHWSKMVSFHQFFRIKNLGLCETFFNSHLPFQIMYSFMQFNNVIQTDIFVFSSHCSGCWRRVWEVTPRLPWLLPSAQPITTRRRPSALCGILNNRCCCIWLWYQSPETLDFIDRWTAFCSPAMIRWQSDYWMEETLEANTRRHLRLKVLWCKTCTD